MATAVIGGRETTQVVISNPISSDVVDNWIAFAQVSPTSEKAYRKGIKNLFYWMTSNALTTITRPAILKYRDYLASKYQATTSNLYLTSAKLFLTFLYTEGYITKNPAEHVKGFKIQAGHKKSAISIQDTKNVIASFDATTLKGARDKALYTLMTVCGLRCIETVRADVGDIEKRGNVFILHLQGKGRIDKTDFVVLPAGVVKLIQSYLTLRGDATAQSPLFTSVSNHNRNGRLNVCSVSRIIKKVLRGNGIDSKRYTAHSLRHTAATQSLIAGASIREVQKMLRHKNIAVTTVYLDELNDLNNPASNLAASAFGI